MSNEGLSGFSGSQGHRWRLDDGPADRSSLVGAFVGGRTLSESLHGQPLRPLTAAAVVETLARAVHEMHRLGSSHGDLTAARVLLEPSDPPRFVDPKLGHLCEENGRELIPRIIGFGIAGDRVAGRNGDTAV